LTVGSVSAVWCWLISAVIERYQHRTRRRRQCIRAETRRRECNAVTLLLSFLRRRGERSAACVETSAAHDLVARYGQHLQDQ